MNQTMKTNLSYQDALSYLPRTPLYEVAKGCTIYDRGQPTDRLYVVILGRVKISSIAGDGAQTVSRIVPPEGLFGEACLTETGPRTESAVALDNVTAMAWTRAEIEQQVQREPLLGLALAQYFARECIDFQERIQTMAVYKTCDRVIIALMKLAADLGAPAADGATRFGWLAHETIAEYVGTSREIVSFQMNRLRRMGFVRYSRKYIDVYTHAIEAQLGNNRGQAVHSMSQSA